ncbi:UNVERIFIED_CONTAM: hypothetical protein H355_003042, partial [Colinus virginianus]
MDNLHLSVTAVLLLCFNHPGSAGTKSQQLLNTHHPSDCWWDGKFLVNCSFMGLAAMPEDISPTAVTADLSYNNIKTFLGTTGRNEDWMLKHLNLSNNLISEISITAFRNLPFLETLNLNGNSINTLTLDLPTPAHGSKRFGEIHHFLPALEVLSAERNNLHAVPTGERFKLLNDLTHKEESGLGKFQFVLFFISGNRVSWWTPKGRISEGSSLPHLTLDKINNLIIHNTEKTDEGLYMCTSNTRRKKYLIYNVQVKERIQASIQTSLVRKTRATNPGVRAGGTQQDLTLAICLSVFITFVCAFCLGALARPCLTRLWMRTCRNKAPAPEHIYANHAFSDETPSREHSISKPVNTQHNTFIIYENTSRNAHDSPTGTAQLYEDVSSGPGHTPSTEEFPKQSNNQINVKKKTVSSNTKSNSSNATYINTGQLSARMDYDSNNEARKLTENSLSSCEDPQNANSTDAE